MKAPLAALIALGLCSCADKQPSEQPVERTAVSTEALTQALLLPFPPGHTWYICQSYVGFSHSSNRPFDIGWTQQSCNGGNNDSGGKPIVAPGSGTVSHMPNNLSGGDFMCISLTGGGAIVLGHVKPVAGIGQGSSVTAGQQVATVRTSTDPDAQNAGIAHLHFEAWSGNGCYSGTAQAFTGAWKMQCAPDLPFNSQYGFYIGTPLTACPPTGTEHDVNGDGRADLVSARDDGNAYVWPGRTDGTFATAVPSFAGALDAANFDGSGHYIVGVADVTGDRRADLVAVHDDGSAYVWPGEASSNFGEVVSSFEGTFDYANRDGTGHHVAGVADVTGDGRADLVTGHTDGNAYVYPGEASGAFGSGVASFSGTFNAANYDGSGHYMVGVADVTGDGRADLVTAHDNGNVYVYPGQASGNFAAYVESFDAAFDPANWDGVGLYVVDVADVTGDGHADLVAIHPDGDAHVYPGEASGSFGAAVTSFDGTLDIANVDGTGHWLAGVGDITGEGRGDLVAMGDDGSAYVWPGEPNGSLGSAIPVFSGTMDFANVDGTGHYIVAPNGPHGAAPATESSSANQAAAASGSGGGSAADPGASDETGGGCGCRIAIGSAPRAWLMVVLAWLVRRRRTPLVA